MSEGFLSTVGVHQKSCMNIASKASLLTSDQDSEDAELRWNEEKNGVNGVHDNKMSFSIQCHNRKDQNEKPQSGMQTPGKGEKFVEGGGGENTEEVFTIIHERPNQYVTMGTTLTTDYKRLLTNVLRENIEVFAWTGSERTTIPSFIIEHQLKIYPLAEPVVHKRRPMTPDGRL
ncbi:hypothetical protein Tco_1545275, partial [Tanacetum coccineum]